MGLTLGYLAAKLGLEYLSEQRAADEEIVCIAETDACCCDAIQVLTGCTFGKGNFIYKDIGKMAFSFISRNSGIGVRLSMKPGVTDASEEERLLLEKIGSERATPEEIKQYETVHQTRSDELFKRGPRAFFEIQPFNNKMPSKARIAPSQLCDKCREPVMETKLQAVNGRKLCRSCHPPINKRRS